MAVRTRAREAETALPKVVEQKADYQRSVDVARKHNGTIIRLERLPQLLNDPEFVKTIEGTESYKRIGYTWFWTDTVGTNLSGYYRINPQGKTLDEMFTFISKEFDSKVQAIPFNERAYFWKGNQPLAVDVWRSDVRVRRLLVSGYCSLDDVAPVVVVEQTKTLATTKPASASTPEAEGAAASIESELNELLESRGISPEKRSRIISVLRDE